MIVRTTLTVGAALALVASGMASAQATGTSPLSCVQPNDRVEAIAIAGGVAYLGGRFTSVVDKGGAVQRRGHLAAVDTASCTLLPWRADTNGEVATITVSSGVVYAGGSFTTVDGFSRGHLAGIGTGGSVNAFNPHLDNNVTGLTTIGGTLYVGGTFLNSGSTKRARLAAFSTTSGDLTSWAPKPTGSVRSLASDGSRVYVGGAFTALDGRTSARHLAALDPGSGAVDTSFSPAASSVNYPVDAVATDGNGVYAAGAGNGGKIGFWNRNGSLQHPLWVTDGDAQAVAVGGGSIYAGGHFVNYCQGGKATGKPPKCLDPLQRKKAYEISVGSGAVTGWNPVFNSALGVFAMAYDASTGRVWVGGDFTEVNFKPVDHLAVFS